MNWPNLGNQHSDQETDYHEQLKGAICTSAKVITVQPKLSITWLTYGIILLLELKKKKLN